MMHGHTNLKFTDCMYSNIFRQFGSRWLKSELKLDYNQTLKCICVHRQAFIGGVERLLILLFIQYIIYIRYFNQQVH